MPWWVASLIVVGLPAAGFFWAFAKVESVHFSLKFTPHHWTPADANPGVYCQFVSDFAAPLPDDQQVAIAVNSAPNAAAHASALRFYDDLVAMRPTNVDLGAVIAAYSCPTSTTKAITPLLP